MVPFIKSRYQQYKEDNGKLATWLGRTAIHYGYPTESFAISETADTLDEPKKTTSQVKNAKKRAKAKAVVVDDVVESDEPAVKGRFILKTRQYLEVTQFLIGKDVSFPAEVVKLLHRCITNRERCAERFVKQGTDTEGHQHFLSQLKDVEALIIAHRTPSAPLAEKSDNVSFFIENKFAQLALENAEEMPDICLPEPPRPPTARRTTGTRFTPESNLVEVVVELLTFFEDVRATREHIKQIWEDFKTGKLDLVTAAVTTNSALELLRQSCDSVMLQIDSAYEGDIFRAIFAMNYILVGGDPMRILAPGLPLETVGVDDELLAAVFDHLLLPNLQILGGLGDVLLQGGVPVYKPGFHGQYDPSLKFDRLQHHKRWKQTEILLCETFMDYNMLLILGDPNSYTGKSMLRSTTNNNYFIFDETAAEMQRFIASSKCTLFLGIVSQVFVDVNFVLGRGTERGMKELRAGAAQMLRSIEKWEAESSGHFLLLGHEGELKVFKEEAAFWARDDPIGQFRAVATSQFPGRKSNFMQRTPIFCGLLLFRLHLTYQRLSFFFANNSLVIQSTAHLYVACRQFGPPYTTAMPEWPDMDLLVDIHGSELFGGGLPKTIDESHLAYLDMVGTPIDGMRMARHAGTDTALPVHLLNRPSGAQVREPKLLRDRTQIQPIFRQKYVVDPKARTVLDRKTILSLLSDLAKGPGELRTKRNNQAPEFSIPQVLSVLEAGLRRETASLRFDYFSMHHRCYKMLIAIKAQSREYLEGKGLPIPPDDYVNAIVLLIFHIASMSQRATSQILKVKNGTRVGSKLLIGAADVMKSALKDPKQRSVEKRKVEGSSNVVV